jgi:hypothetical protein
MVPAIAKVNRERPASVPLGRVVPAQRRQPSIGIFPVRDIVR